MAPELPHQIVGIRPGREAARDDVPGRRLPSDAGVRRSFRHQPTIQFYVTVESTARIASASGGEPVRAGIRIPLRSQSRLPDASTEIVALKICRYDSIRSPGYRRGRHRGGRRSAALRLAYTGSGVPRSSGGGAIRSARARRGRQSATAALHIACLALGLGPGDTVVDGAEHFRRHRQLRALLRRRRGLRRHRCRNAESQCAGAHAKLVDAARSGGCPRRSSRCISRDSPATWRRFLGSRSRIRLPGHRGRLHAIGAHCADGSRVGSCR